MHRQKHPGIFADGKNLEPVADNRRLLAQGFQFIIAHRGTASDIKSVKRPAIAVAFAQYRLPAQTRLRAFQDQIFEQQPVIVNRDTPFPVVIFAVEFLAGLAAEAALLSVCSRHWHGPRLAAPAEVDNFIQQAGYFIRQAGRPVHARHPGSTSRSVACRH